MIQILSIFVKEYVFGLIEKVQKIHDIHHPHDTKSEHALFSSILHKIRKQFDPFTCDQEVLSNYNCWPKAGPNPYVLKP